LAAEDASLRRTIPLSSLVEAIVRASQEVCEKLSKYPGTEKERAVLGKGIVDLLAAAPGLHRLDGEASSC
jgi:hypothetical protein